MKKSFGLSSAIWILVAFCVYLPAPASCLKCYVCNSLTDANCDNIKDQQYLTDCSEVNKIEKQNYTNCRIEKFSAVSAAFDMETKRTIRTCGLEKHPKFSCYYSSNKDLKGSTCECIEDGCNGSSILYFASKVLLSVVLCGFLASLLAT